jgi:hypothetical protein
MYKHIATYASPYLVVIHFFRTGEISNTISTETRLRKLSVGGLVPEYGVPDAIDLCYERSSPSGIGKAHAEFRPNRGQTHMTDWTNKLEKSVTRPNNYH